MFMTTGKHRYVCSYKIQLIRVRVEPTQTKTVQSRENQLRPTERMGNPAVSDQRYCANVNFRSILQLSCSLFCRDLDIVYDTDLELLCDKLKAVKYRFSDFELMEVRKSIANCQYRKGVEFKLRLSPTSEDPTPEQHKSVKHFASDVRRR